MPLDDEPLTDSDDLIASLIGGIVEDEPWHGFVFRLRLAFCANHANVIFRRSGLARTFMTQSSSPEIEQFGDLTERHIPAHDPIRYYEMEAFRAYPIGAFLGDLSPADHPFTARFLAPLGMDQLLICRVASADGLQAWLSITRAGQEAFSRNECRRFEGIARLFSKALTTFGRLKSAEDRSGAYARAVRAHATGLIQLDQDGTVLHLDEQARAWIAQETVLRMANGRLQLARNSVGDAFEPALRRILSEQGDEEFLVVEGRDESFELLIYRAAEPFEPAWTHGTRAIIYLTQVGREIAPSLSRLSKLFGFTRREAALARLLASGRTVSDAAVELGISEQTARAYLRQIFQKASVTRQAELVRRIQGSLAAIE